MQFSAHKDVFPPLTRCRLAGMGGRAGGALSLQHTLLLAGAGQRGGRRGRGSDVTAAAERLTAGGFISIRSSIKIPIMHCFLLTCGVLVSPTAGGGDEPEETGGGVGRFPVIAEK